MLSVLNDLRKRAPVNFDIIAVNLDQGYEGFEVHIIEDYLAANGIPYHIVAGSTPKAKANFAASFTQSITLFFISDRPKPASESS